MIVFALSLTFILNDNTSFPSIFANLCIDGTGVFNMKVFSYSHTCDYVLHLLCHTFPLMEPNPCVSHCFHTKTLIVKLSITLLYSEYTGIYNNHIIFWISVVPLPFVSSPLVFNDLIRYCSIIMSGVRPAQLPSDGLILIAWPPFSNIAGTCGWVGAYCGVPTDFVNGGRQILYQFCDQKVQKSEVLLAMLQ